MPIFRQTQLISSYILNLPNNRQIKAGTLYAISLGKKQTPPSAKFFRTYTPNMLWRILNFDWASAILCPALVPSWQVISLFLSPSLSPSLSLSSLVSRYLIAAGKCFQLTRWSGSLIFTFNFQEISSNSFKKIRYLFGNFDFCTEVESRRSRS